jgi:hypothetical protein
MSAALAGSRNIGEALDKGDMAAVDEILNNSDLNLTDEEKSKILRMSGEEAEEYLRNKAKTAASKRTEIKDDDQNKVKAQKEAEEAEQEAKHAYELAESAKKNAEKEHNDK